MTTGAQRLAMQQLNSRAADVPDWPTATIVSITAGGGTDGQDLVTVSYNGATLDLPHADHYTPVVGHVVTLCRSNGTWNVFCRFIGFPSG